MEFLRVIGIVVAAGLLTTGTVVASEAAEPGRVPTPGDQYVDCVPPSPPPPPPPPQAVPPPPALRPPAEPTRPPQRVGGRSGTPATGSGDGGATRPPAGGRTPGGAYRGAEPARPKAKAAGVAVPVPWEPVFLPVARRPGYAAATASIDEAVRHSAGDGGWASAAGRPTIVLLSDPGDARQQAAARSLEDSRFRAAAHFFNCFKIDSRNLAAETIELELRVYDRAGEPVGSATGDRRIRGAFALLEKAFGETSCGDLSRVLPTMEKILDGRAVAEEGIKVMERHLVCPDCGQCHDGIVRALEKYRARYDEYCRSYDAYLNQAAN